MINTKILSSSASDIAEAAAIIRGGGLVIFPTETVYGLGADALNSNAADKIYAAKGRPSDNPLISHLALPSDAERLCVTCELYYRLAARFMPGPLTVILPKKHNADGSPIIPARTTGGHDTAAVRVPSNLTAHMLIEESCTSIAAPSANLSGSPSPTTLRHVVEDMYGRVDAIIDGGESEIGLESTIVMPDGDTLRLLRPGEITVEQLRQVCEKVAVDPAVTGKFDGVPLAPGMKYRHYAPKSRVIMLDGGDSEVYAFLADKTNCGILCFDGDETLLKRENSLSLGARDDHETQAHRLFTALRDLDGAEVIYARMPTREGVGLAVFNRLSKAAGYEVIKL